MKFSTMQFIRAAVIFAAGAVTVASQAQTNQSRTPLPEVVVPGERPMERPGFLGEEQLVGENAQPEWTTRRRFATTRVYVLPPWQWEFEQWWRGKFPRAGKGSHRFQTEIGLGLPHRLQLDIYENIARDEDGHTRHEGVQLEGRWALAEWGKIPLNPTIYGEWKFNDKDPDAFEVKLLLGEEIASRWHWGLNLFYEQEVGGGRGSEIGFAQALSYSIVDQKLSAGVEMKLERASGPNLDGKPETEFLVGPSVQWRPCSRVHLDLVPLFGVTDDSPRVEAYVVLGIELGGKSHAKGQAPASSRSR
jgi:hypothetical protein